MAGPPSVGCLMFQTRDPNGYALEPNVWHRTEKIAKRRLATLVNEPVVHADKLPHHERQTWDKKRCSVGDGKVSKPRGPIGGIQVGKYVSTGYVITEAESKRRPFRKPKPLTYEEMTAIDTNKMRIKNGCSTISNIGLLRYMRRRKR
jgi:hypothetical protein